MKNFITIVVICTLVFSALWSIAAIASHSMVPLYIGVGVGLVVGVFAGGWNALMNTFRPGDLP